MSVTNSGGVQTSGDGSRAIMAQSVGGGGGSGGLDDILGERPEPVQSAGPTYYWLHPSPGGPGWWWWWRRSEPRRSPPAAAESRVACPRGSTVAIGPPRLVGIATGDPRCVFG